MGFKNIFLKRGYESDDLIASLVRSSLEDKKASIVIVSADHDLYQLISSQTSVYLLNKKKLYTQEDFTKEWGISPTQWIDVKSIAGCNSDNIIGIDGVGEVLAAKYIRGQIKSSSNLFRKIAEKSFVWRQNDTLVRLPYLGCPKVTAIPEGRWRFKTPLKGIKSRG
jgi:DNA polymerase-1